MPSIESTEVSVLLQHSPKLDDTKMSILAGVPPMVQSAKALAFDVTSPAKVAEWRKHMVRILLGLVILSKFI